MRRQICPESAVQRVGVQIEQEKHVAFFYLQNAFAVDSAGRKEHTVKALLLALAGAGEYVPDIHLEKKCLSKQI